jgi:hypothetical protein
MQLPSHAVPYSHKLEDFRSLRHTDKKENQIFLIYREIQNGAVAKSYMNNGLPIYREIFLHFLIY